MFCQVRATKSLALVCLLAIACCSTADSPLRGQEGSGDGDEQPNATPNAEQLGQALADFNHGAALLGRYKYEQSAERSQAAVDVFPDWVPARFNLALAHLNMQQSQGAVEHLELARKGFEEILAKFPDHLSSRFSLGMYHQHQGQNDQAAECFRQVYEADPDDLHAAYKYAEMLTNIGRNEEGIKVLERIVERDPGFVSAIYRLATQYQRTRQRDKAMPLFKRFQELNAAELTSGSFTVDKMYGAAGKYYQALGADNLPIAVSPSPNTLRVLFSPIVTETDSVSEPWQLGGSAIRAPGAAVGDVDADGDLDLCLTSCGGEGLTTLWLNDGSGRFVNPIQLADRGIAPCFGDIDNDGDLDIWLGRVGENLLLENDGQGHFSTAKSSTPLGVADGFTSCTRLLDLDSDGDLDLMAMRLAQGTVPAAGTARAMPSYVFNNNRDGTFDDMAERLDLALPDTAVAAVVFDDFDDDRDMDLLIFPVGKAPILWVNDRVWRQRLLGASATGLEVSGVVAATTGDPNKDGRRDLLLFTGQEVQLYLNQGQHRFKVDEVFADQYARLAATSGQFADMDNDGDLDIVLADALRADDTRGPALLLNDWPNLRYLDAVALDAGNLLGTLKTADAATCVVADFTGNGCCDVLLLTPAARPRLVRNVTAAGNWIQLDLQGTRSRDQMTRSNGSAIGARVEIKSGLVSQQYVVGTSSGATTMAPLRLHAGLGEHTQVEWMRILWPDAVLQAEMEVAAGQQLTIAEVPRKTSSCPHLFAWDGQRFALVSDFGGMGGLGYLVAPGVYAQPDPTEYVPMRDLAPKDGHYVMHVLEPLEEVIYFDEAKLVAVDHPLGTTVYPHELMAVNSSPPPFEIFCFDEPIEAVRAVDHRGEDVTQKLRVIDRQYAGATEPDRRFSGLAAEHYVELDFGDRLQRMPADARWILMMHGWVEYGYSSTNFAAGQAGLTLKAPSVYAWRDDRWVQLFHEVGYPAGLQHMMTLDVTNKLLASDTKIRITSNMELFWDRIYLAASPTVSDCKIQEVPASHADLHFRGYPREYSPDGRHPNLYDYGNIDSTLPWKLMTGNYTRFGDVLELLEQPDDCYVIMGRGEEVTLQFPVRAFDPVQEGYQRSFILKTDSYCKDMDLYTAYPEGVEPLPFHSMTSYPYRADEQYPETEKTREYRRRYNTRIVKAGRDD